MLLLALVAVVPVFGYRLVEIDAERARLLDEAREKMVSYAREAAGRQAGMINSTEVLLSAMTNIPNIHKGTEKRCRETLQALLKPQPWIRGLGIADSKGIVRCTSSGLGVGSDLSDREYVLDAQRKRTFVISGILKSRLEGDPYLIVGAHPVFKRVGTVESGNSSFPIQSGKVEFYHIVTFEVSWLADLANEAGSRAAADAYVIDSEGHIIGLYSRGIAATPEPDLGSKLQTLSWSSPYNWGEVELASGTRMVFGFVGIPGTSARLFVGKPRDDILGRVDQQLGSAYTMLALVTFFIVLVAWAGGEIFFVRPIRSLARVAAQVADGNTTARASTRTSLHEVDILADAFNRMVDRLNDVANRDGLTGLANRRRLDAHLHQLWSNRERQDAHVGVAMIDVDRFKAYNDHFEHLGGDICLKKVATVVAGHAKRAGDLAARFGGEEFCIVLEGIEQDNFIRHCRRLRQAIEALGEPQAPEIGGVVTASIGIAYGRVADYPDPDDMIAAADRALFSAKAGGRNQVVFSDGENGDVLELSLTA